MPRAADPTPPAAELRTQCENWARAIHDPNAERAALYYAADPFAPDESRGED